MTETLTDKQLVAKCRRKAKTSGDLGVTIQRMRRLEEKGLVRRDGTRRNARIGRPAIAFIAIA